MVIMAYSSLCCLLAVTIVFSADYSLKVEALNHMNVVANNMANVVNHKAGSIHNMDQAIYYNARAIKPKYVTNQESHGHDMVTSIPGDHGTVYDCGHFAHNYTFYWSPKEIKLQNYTTIYVNVTATIGWSSGPLCCTIYTTNVPVPVYQGCMSATCADVHKVLPDVCPFHAGETIDWMQGRTLLVHPHWPIPAGDYHGNCTAQNEDGVLAACGQAHVSYREK